MPTGGIKIVCEANLSSLSTTEGVTCGRERILTGTTNTCTPTQLRNIEQLFFEAENAGVESEMNQKNAAGFVPPLVLGDTVTTSSGRTYVNLDKKNWQQGGVTTVMSPTALSTQPLFSELQIELQPQGMEQGNILDSLDDSDGRRIGGRRSTFVKDEDLSPEEEERRRVRRERNKLAAARCRKRRVDQTDSLQKDVDVLEDKKRALQEEIHALQSQKEELQFVLDAHKTVCKKSAFKVGQVTAVSRSNLPPTEPRVVVKSEPPTDENVTHLTHAESMDEVDSTTTTDLTSLPGCEKPKRPQFLGLSLQNGSSLMRSIGVPIETPTSIVKSLNFDALMDGRTGLTPTNVLTPLSINMTISANSLNTPSVTTPASGCGSQQMRSGHGSLNASTIMSELSSPNGAAPNLVSL